MTLNAQVEQSTACSDSGGFVAFVEVARARGIAQLPCRLRRQPLSSLSRWRSQDSQSLLSGSNNSGKYYLPRNEALRVDEVCTEFARRLCDESAASNSAAKPNRKWLVLYWLPRLNAPLAALAPQARIQLGAYLDISQSLNAEVRHTNVSTLLSV